MHDLLLRSRLSHFEPLSWSSLALTYAAMDACFTAPRPGSGRPRRIPRFPLSRGPPTAAPRPGPTPPARNSARSRTPRLERRNFKRPYLRGRRSDSDSDGTRGFATGRSGIALFV